MSTEPTESSSNLPEYPGNVKQVVSNRRQYRGRRAILRGIVGGTAMAAGVMFLKPLTGRKDPAASAFRSCGISGLTYAGTCLGANYSTTCSNGCARQSSASSSTWCATSSYNSRHRASCNWTRNGEKIYISNGRHYRTWSRKDECYSGGYDGWQWCQTNCSCSTRCWSCNDGYYRLYTNSGTTLMSYYAPSICMRTTC